MRIGTKDDTEVALSVNGHNISRARTKDLNGYRIDGETLEACGSDVPKQVQQALNLCDINIQTQFDGYFLLFSAPGQIGKAITDVVHLESAQKKADALASLLRSAKQKAKFEHEGVSRLEEELQDFDGLDDYSEAVETARNLDVDIRSSEGRLNALDGLLSDFKQVDSVLLCLDVPSVLETILADVEELITNLDTLAEDMDNLDDIVFHLRKATDVSEFWGDLDAMSVRLDEIEADAAAYLELTYRADGLFAMEENLMIADDSIKKSSLQLDESEVEYNELLAELDECPACGQSLDDGAKARLLENEG